MPTQLNIDFDVVLEEFGGTIEKKFDMILKVVFWEGEDKCLRNFHFYWW